MDTSPRHQKGRLDSNTPPNHSRNAAELNVVNTESSCLEKAIMRLREIHPDEFEILWSTSGKKPLEKHSFLNYFKSAAVKHNKNEKLRLRLERLYLALQPCKQITLIAARADPLMVAPYAMGGLFLLLQVLPTIME